MHATLIRTIGRWRERAKLTNLRILRRTRSSVVRHRQARGRYSKLAKELVEVGGREVMGPFLRSRVVYGRYGCEGTPETSSAPKEVRYERDVFAYCFLLGKPLNGEAHSVEIICSARVFEGPSTCLPMGTGLPAQVHTSERSNSVQRYWTLLRYIVINCCRD